MADKQGLYRKFDIARTDGTDAPGGKHHGCRYFVLDLDHDAHAPAALEAYAQSCAAEKPVLAGDLFATAAGLRNGDDPLHLGKIELRRPVPSGEERAEGVHQMEALRALAIAQGADPGSKPMRAFDAALAALREPGDCGSCVALQAQIDATRERFTDEELAAADGYLHEAVRVIREPAVSSGGLEASLRPKLTAAEAMGEALAAIDTHEVPDAGASVISELHSLGFDVLPSAPDVKYTINIPDWFERTDVDLCVEALMRSAQADGVQGDVAKACRALAEATAHGWGNSAMAELDVLVDAEVDPGHLGEANRELRDEISRLRSALATLHNEYLHLLTTAFDEAHCEMRKKILAAMRATGAGHD